MLHCCGTAVKWLLRSFPVQLTKRNKIADVSLTTHRTFQIFRQYRFTNNQFKNLLRMENGRKYRVEKNRIVVFCGNEVWNLCRIIWKDGPWHRAMVIWGSFIKENLARLYSLDALAARLLISTYCGYKTVVRKGLYRETDLDCLEISFSSCIYRSIYATILSFKLLASEKNRS